MVYSFLILTIVNSNAKNVPSYSSRLYWIQVIQLQQLMLRHYDTRDKNVINTFPKCSFQTQNNENSIFIKLTYLQFHDTVVHTYALVSAVYLFIIYLCMLKLQFTTWIQFVNKQTVDGYCLYTMLCLIFCRYDKNSNNIKFIDGTTLCYGETIRNMTTSQLYVNVNWNENVFIAFLLRI